MTHPRLTANIILVFSLLVLANGIPGNIAATLDDAVPPPQSSIPAQNDAAAERPNILLIISDDQRYDTMEYMPRTKALIFDQGVSFPNAYVTTPLCCPSRSSILTGMYAHTTGVRFNTTPLLKPTFVELLHEQGYYTGLVGKYLNSWDGSPRPEFDSWVALCRKNEDGSLASTGGYDYFDPLLNVNGTMTVHPGYQTHHLRDYALDFLRVATGQEQPFALVFAPYAPHTPALPAPGDEDLYPDLAPHRPPSHNEADVSDKPRWIQSRRLLTDNQIAELDKLRRQQLQSLHSLDQTIETLLTFLDQQGQLDNTLVIYLSDNGHFWGEHRFTQKHFVYEEASRTPFGLRYPSLVAPGRVEQHLVANIDIAPTIYDLAGIPIPVDVDGQSLVPLLTNGDSTWREDLLIEGWQNQAYAALHTGRYVYVETGNDLPELYDLVTDPYQIRNQAQNPEYAGLVAELDLRLDQRLGTPRRVRVAGPSAGSVNASYAFTSAVSPKSASGPTTHHWQATGQISVTHVGSISDSVSFSWEMTGTKVITVTASNDAWGIVTDTHPITITIAPTPTPTPSPSSTPTSSPSPTPSATATAPTRTPTASPTGSLSRTPTASATIPTETPPVITPTATSTPTATPTSVAATATPAPSSTSAPASPPSPTPSATATAPTRTPTASPTGSLPRTPTASATARAEPPPAATATATISLPTVTSTRAATPTSVAATRTSTPGPTSTPASPPSPTPRATATTPTRTPTASPTGSLPRTPTASATTPAETLPAATATATTSRPTVTSTPTSVVATPTASATAPVPTRTVTPLPPTAQSATPVTATATTTPTVRPPPTPSRTAAATSSPKAWVTRTPLASVTPDSHWRIYLLIVRRG